MSYTKSSRKQLGRKKSVMGRPPDVVSNKLGPDADPYKRLERREVEESKSFIMRAIQSACTPMTELDEMIRMGWGGTARNKLPENWREVPGPDSTRFIKETDSDEKPTE